MQDKKELTSLQNSSHETEEEVTEIESSLHTHMIAESLTTLINENQDNSDYPENENTLVHALTVENSPQKPPVIKKIITPKNLKFPHFLKKLKTLTSSARVFLTAHLKKIAVVISVIISVIILWNNTGEEEKKTTTPPRVNIVLPAPQVKSFRATNLQVNHGGNQPHPNNTFDSGEDIHFEFLVTPEATTLKTLQLHLSVDVRIYNRQGKLVLSLPKSEHTLQITDTAKASSVKNSFKFTEEIPAGIYNMMVQIQDKKSAKVSTLQTRIIITQKK